MSRKEIVLLVSRAIALLQIINAVMTAVGAVSVLYNFYRGWAAEPYPTYRNPFLTSANFFSLLLILLHVIVLLIIAAIFWNCGPKVERWLMPTGVEQEPQEQWPTAG